MDDATTIDLDALGVDARVMASNAFGMGRRSTLTLQLRQSRPTERTKAALDELVAKGVASVAPFNDLGGLVYSPLVDCAPAFLWMAGLRDDGAHIAMLRGWTLYEPIDEEQAYELTSPFGQGVWDKERRGRKLKDNPYDAAVDPAEHAEWRRGHRAGGR